MNHNVYTIRQYVKESKLFEHKYGVGAMFLWKGFIVYRKEKNGLKKKYGGFIKNEQQF
jgi:hypothetical protein